MTIEMITALSSIVISVFTLAYTMIAKTRQDVLQSLTLNRMEWIKDVRSLLGDFACYYRAENIEAMKDAKAKLELFMRRDVDDYYLLLDHMHVCMENGYNERDYEKFLILSSYILARPWQRMSIEVKKNIFMSEQQIRREVDKRTKKLLELARLFDKPRDS